MKHVTYCTLLSELCISWCSVLCWQTVPSVQESLGGRICFQFAKFSRRWIFPGFLPNKHWSLSHSMLVIILQHDSSNHSSAKCLFSLYLDVLTKFLDYILFLSTPSSIKVQQNTKKKQGLLIFIQPASEPGHIFLRDALHTPCCALRTFDSPQVL